MTGHTKEPWAVGFRAYDVSACDGEMKICDIRGWGYLTGKGALGLEPEAAIAIQDANARRIVSCVNACATIPDPQAFMEAARGMREALEAQEKVTAYAADLAALSADGTRITEQHMAKGRELISAAKELRAKSIATFDAAQGEQ